MQPAGSSLDRVCNTIENPLPAALGEPVLETLISEIRRYLVVVEVFRGEGYEPRWA